MQVWIMVFFMYVGTNQIISFNSRYKCESALRSIVIKNIGTGYCIEGMTNTSISPKG